MDITLTDQFATTSNPSEVPAIHRLFTLAMVADLANVSVSTARRWHRRGLIRSTQQIKKLHYFDFQETAIARQLGRLSASGISIQSLEKELRRVSHWAAPNRRPLADWTFQLEGQQLLLRRQQGFIEPNGQIRINFDPGDQDTADAVSAPQATRPLLMGNLPQQDSSGQAPLSTPMQYLQLAEQLEDHDEIEAAIEVYRSLQLAFGPRAESCFRLAELLYQSGELQASRERFFTAIELDENLVEARASLGCVLVELGQLHLAVATFQGALEIHDDYPDVHFHLARALDAVGEALQAKSHWRRFVELAPHSPWMEEAQLHLESAQDDSTTLGTVAPTT